MGYTRRNLIRALNSIIKPPSKWDDFIDRLDYFYYKITLPFSIFRQSCEQIITWFPIIWNNRDWDSYYTYKILHFKIKQSRIHMERYGCHKGDDKCIKEMKTAEALLKRLFHNEYDSDAIRIKRLKLDGECKCPDKFIIFHPDFCDLCNRNFSNRIKLEHRNETYNRNYTFSFISKHIERWWT